MLILSCDSPTALTPEAIDRCLSWPGPHLLAFGPPGALDRTAIAAAQRHFLTFEFASPPTSGIDIVRSVILRAIGGRIDPCGPLLFAQGMPDDAEIAAATRAVKRDKWLIKALIDPGDGHLTQLLLGAGIIENPLLERLFSTLEATLTDAMTDACLKEIDTHLVWHEAAGTS